MTSNHEDNVAEQDHTWAVAVRDHDEAMERRKFTRRAPVAGIRTKLGDVVDLTPAGMRVICGRLKPAQREVLRLDLMHTKGSVRVNCRTVWVKKLSRGRHELGMAFEDVNPSTQAALTALARLKPKSITVEIPHE